MYAKVVRVLSKGYLPISLLPPSTLQNILGKDKKAIQVSNPDYSTVIERLQLYYNMKLVTFGTDKGKKLIVQFQVLIQPYTQQQVILY